MSEIAIFENAAFDYRIRVIVRNGEPWFGASDVALALGYAKPRNAIAAHCKHAELLKGPESGPLTSSPYGILIIPESDVYRLVMRSELPAAEAFQDWIMEEVIPSIRKTGAYGIAQSGGVHELGLTIHAISERLSAMEARNDRLMDKIEGDYHLVQKGRVFERDPNCMDMSQTAHFLKQRFGIDIGNKRLFGVLRKAGYVHKRKGKECRPTQKGLANGLKEDWRRYRTGIPYCTAIVTRRGITNILALLARQNSQRGFAGISVTNQFNF